MFTTALLTIAKTRKQPKCPSIDERTKKMGCIRAGVYNSATRKNDTPPFVTLGIDPRGYAK